MKLISSEHTAAALGRFRRQLAKRRWTLTRPPGDIRPGGIEVAGELLVVFDAASASEALIEIGRRLAEALSLAPTVLFVETPSRREIEEPADVLALASRNGFTVAKAPAADLIAGARAYAEMSPVRHLVIPRQTPRRRWLSLIGLEEVPALAPGLDTTVIDVTPVMTRAEAKRPERERIRTASALGYVAAVLATLATIPVLLLLRSLFGAQALGFLFVLPVLAVAARFGLRPALACVLLSTLCYDLLLLRPGNRPAVLAPQDIVVAGALVAVAFYSSALTARLRERVALSDRSAQENASLAAFGVKLAREADWEGTGAVVCAEIARMFDVRSAIFRKRDDAHALVAAEPAEAAFGPIDASALQMAWDQGVEAGAGTGMAAAADWLFQPLTTSLGTLAVLAVAREDGRAPIAESRRVLFSTFVAQAALAHERLRLEDLMRGGIARVPGATG